MCGSGLNSQHSKAITHMTFEFWNLKKKNLSGFEVKVSWKMKSWCHGFHVVVFYSALLKAATMQQISRMTLKTVARQQLNVIQLVNATVYILQCLYFAQVSEYQSETNFFWLDKLLSSYLHVVWQVAVLYIKAQHVQRFVFQLLPPTAEKNNT